MPFNIKTLLSQIQLETSSNIGPKGSKYNPGHYQKGTIQVWDFIADQNLDYLKGCIIKYVCRAGSKPNEPELDDLLKAKAYLEKAISFADANDLAKRKA